MKHIWVDMAKKDFQAFVDSNTNAKFENNKTGFNKLIKYLSKWDIIGVESTSNYHHAFAKFFIENWFEVREINPITTKQMIKSSVRKRKTDKTDSEIISKLLDYWEWHSMHIKSFESDICDTKILGKLYKQTIKHLDNQINKLEEEINNITDNDWDRKILESMTWISSTLSANIKAEIWDINRFSSAKKLVAFAWLDPRIKQSWESLNSTWKLTKRGSSTLRYSLFLAARSNICSNTVFTKYYYKMRDKWRNHTQSCTATWRKLLETIFYLLRDRKTFDKNYFEKKFDKA